MSSPTPAGPAPSLGFARSLWLAPVAGRLLAVCWMLALAGAEASGSAPTMNARMLALVGVAWGIAWARAPHRMPRPVAAVVGLQAVAAAIALDPAMAVSWPLFVLAGALAGDTLRGPRLAWHAAALAAAPIAVGWLAPGRTPAGPAHAVVLSGGVLLVVTLVAGLRRPSGAAAGRGVPHGLHDALRSRAIANPRRFATLVGRDGSRPRSRFASVRAVVPVPETSATPDPRLLRERIERVLAEAERLEVAALNTEGGTPGRSVEELLERAEAELVMARRRVRIVPSGRGAAEPVGASKP